MRFLVRTVHCHSCKKLSASCRSGRADGTNRQRTQPDSARFAVRESVLNCLCMILWKNCTSRGVMTYSTPSNVIVSSHQEEYSGWHAWGRGEVHVCMDLVVKPEGKRPLRKARRRGEYNIKMYLRRNGLGVRGLS